MKRRGVVRFDLKGLGTPENVAFLCVFLSENGKNLIEKHGGSSLAAKLHGVPCFFSLKFLPFSTKDDVTVF